MYTHTHTHTHTLGCRHGEYLIKSLNFVRKIKETHMDTAAACFKIFEYLIVKNIGVKFIKL